MFCYRTQAENKRHQDCKAILIRNPLPAHELVKGNKGTICFLLATRVQAASTIVHRVLYGYKFTSLGQMPRRVIQGCEFYGECSLNFSVTAIHVSPTRTYEGTCLSTLASLWHCTVFNFSCSSRCVLLFCQTFYLHIPVASDAEHSLIGFFSIHVFFHIKCLI